MLNQTIIWSRNALIYGIFPISRAYLTRQINVYDYDIWIIFSYSAAAVATGLIYEQSEWADEWMKSIDRFNRNHRSST